MLLPGLRSGSIALPALRRADRSRDGERWCGAARGVREITQLIEA